MLDGLGKIIYRLLYWIGLSVAIPWCWRNFLSRSVIGSGWIISCWASGLTMSANQQNPTPQVHREILSQSCQNLFYNLLGSFQHPYTLLRSPKGFSCTVYAVIYFSGHPSELLHVLVAVSRISLSRSAHAALWRGTCRGCDLSETEQWGGQYTVYGNSGWYLLLFKQVCNKIFLNSPKILRR